MRSLASIALFIALAACGASDDVLTAKQNFQIIPTTGVFTEAEEAIHQTRFYNLVKAFASGKTTTDYDTEIYFGENLISRPLPRGEADYLSPDLIEDLISYARDYNSDSFITFSNKLDFR